jgi:hypothetical protein
MIQDWMKLLYPLTPVVHLPSFLADLEAGKETNDPIFFSIVASMCAALVSTVSSSFNKYKSLDSSFPYHECSQMVDCIQDMITQLRTPDYFDHSTHGKWTISFLLGAAQGNCSRLNRAMVFAAESNHHMRQLACWNATSYEGLTNIESQLRKKAACLCAIGH